MAVSLQRVAAFEFLIQFRSAGRSQLRSSVRQLKSLVGLSGSTSRFGKALGAVGAAFSIVSATVKSAIGVWASWARANAILIGGLGLAAFGAGRLADNFVNLSNRIRVASDGTTALSTIQGKLLDISNRSRAPFDNIAELYGRIAINAKQFGISQEEILRAVEITGKTFKIGGSNAREASQAALQFAQALGSNRLSGDELRAVREQATELSQTIARGLNASGDFGAVGVGNLKELAEAGKLTTRVVIDALLSQERIVNARFGRVQATFSDGITTINSSLRFFIGSVVDSLKLGPRFFNFFDGIAERLNNISKVSGRFGTAILAFPRFLQAIGQNSLSNLISDFQKFGERLQTFPELILNIADNINQFIGLRDAGFSLQESALSAFGISLEELQEKFKPFSDTVTLLTTQFKGFLAFTKTLVSLFPDIINGIVKILDIILTGQEGRSFRLRRATANAGREGEITGDNLNDVIKALRFDRTNEEDLKNTLSAIKFLQDSAVLTDSQRERLDRIRDLATNSRDPDTGFFQSNKDANDARGAIVNFIRSLEDATIELRKIDSDASTSGGGINDGISGDFRGSGTSDIINGGRY